MKISKPASALLDEIRIDGDSAPVAALQSSHETNLAWDELIDHGLIHCWEDESGIGYCECPQ